MNNGEQPIYPDPMRGADQSFSNQQPEELPRGLTKREYFAGLAMQGFMSYEFAAHAQDADGVAKSAVKYADALLKALETNKEQGI